jgi:hypothetical protein
MAEHWVAWKVVSMVDWRVESLVDLMVVKMVCCWEMLKAERLVV